MLRLPGKHPAFAFSDPAGANACFAYARICRDDYHTISLLFSNRNYHSSLSNGFQVHTRFPEFETQQIDCLFTGTSHPQSSGYFEVKCIKRAVSKGIKTISFIDHWVNFRLRFEDENGQQIYPDEIWVVDENARELAIKEGLPKEKIRVQANPYLEYLAGYWKPSFKEKSYLQNLGISSNSFHILFAPDPLSLRNGKETVGFTEEEALVDILSVITTNQLPVHLLVKCHPLQPMANLAKIISHSDTLVSVIEDADTLELIHASDLVVGFYSNLLLEAETLGKKVIRYFPGSEQADLLRHKVSLQKVKSKQELLQALKIPIYG